MARKNLIQSTRPYSSCLLYRICVNTDLDIMKLLVSIGADSRQADIFIVLDYGSTLFRFTFFYLNSTSNPYCSLCIPQPFCLRRQA